MSQLSIALAEDDMDWVKSRVAAGEYPTVDAYFAHLAKRDRAEAEEAVWLQLEIDKGLASGVDPRPSQQVFSDIRAKYFSRDG